MRGAGEGGGRGLALWCGRLQIGRRRSRCRGVRRGCCLSIGPGIPDRKLDLGGYSVVNSGRVERTVMPSSRMMVRAVRSVPLYTGP